MRKRKAKDVRSGWIYYIQCETTRRIKIGWTMLTPPDRLMALKTGSPTKLFVLTAQPGRYDVEFKVHADLAKSRLHGEWFENSLTVQRHIEAVLKQFGPAPWVPPEATPYKETDQEKALRMWQHHMYLNDVETGRITFAPEDYLHEAMAWSDIRRRRLDDPSLFVQAPNADDITFG